MSKVLLTPGPCMTSEAVRQAAALPDLNHRDPEFLEIASEIRERLRVLYPPLESRWHSYLLGGSGTLAVEAMVTSCVVSGPVLVIENGYYSERIQEILSIHKIPFSALHHDWFEPWNFDRIQEMLTAGFEAVIGTHNETTLGRLNDIGRLGLLCEKFGVRCLIDAMSSFGADPIEFANLDAVCTSSNKCLHGVPGVGIVFVRDSLVERMAEVPRRSFYMSLPMYEGLNPPITPPIPALSALRQALREVPSGTALARGAIYSAHLAFVFRELLRRGFSSAIPIEASSCTLGCFAIPSGFSFDAWFEANLNEGFVVYGCKGNLRERYFQVSVMGEVTLEQLRLWIAAVDRILNR